MKKLLITPMLLFFIFFNNNSMIINMTSADSPALHEIGPQSFLLRHLYSIFNFLKFDETSTHTSLVLLDDSLEMLAKYLDKDFDDLADKMVKSMGIDWLKKIDDHMQVSYGGDFRKWQYYEIFKSIYLNKFSWKEKTSLIYDLVLDRTNPHGLLSDFLSAFEAFYKIDSCKTQVRWHLTEKHDYKLLFLFYHIIKIQGYAQKVLIACKFKNLDVRFYLDPALKGICVGYFKENIGRRMFDLDHTVMGIANMKFYKKMYAEAIKSLDIDLIGYDFRK